MARGRPSRREPSGWRRAPRPRRSTRACPLGELLPARPWAPAIVERLALDVRDGRAYAPGAAPDLAGRDDEADALLAEIEAAGPAGARAGDTALAAFLERDGRLVRLGDGFAVTPAAYDRARAAALAEFEREGSIRLARYRDALGVSRRSAQLLLERLDTDGITRRSRGRASGQAIGSGARVISNVQPASPRRMQLVSHDLRCVAVVASGALDEPAQEHAELPRRGVDDAHAVVAELRHVQLRRPRVRESWLGTSSWMRVSTVSRNSRAVGEMAKNAG